MKKIIALLLCAVLAAGLTAGCAGQTPGEQGGDRLHIVATIFPQYDWTREILGERAQEAELTLLMGGVDLHSFQPTAEDIVKISSCDLFIYVGGESDRWVDDVLKTAVNRDMAVIDLMDALGDAVREEELTEGMEAGEEEEEESPAYDEHVWLSLKNAVTACRCIADALCGLDPAGRGVYEENAENYIARLEALDREYRETVDGASRDTLLFADRFPFRYMADDYGLRCYAAFPGCSAETEASFETIVFLANKVDELGLQTVLRLESSDGSVARTVVENTKTKDQTVLTMDSMQSVTKQQAEDGATYLSVMMRNLAVLRDALM
ncbi:MAG: zinc ABC transporter substrate-binding protein [Oscillospiraceae bacterium]|nr:zinc ABC transporter substrate-binding protein [Oscillospiraceae bacterium]